MPFNPTFQINNFFDDPLPEGLEPEVVSEAVRLAIRDTMTRYYSRVEELTRHWKPENRPRFHSNFNPNQQLGLANLEDRPIFFELVNKRIWGLVSAGAPEHIIKPKEGGEILRFTGWAEFRGDRESEYDPGRTIFDDVLIGQARRRKGINIQSSLRGQVGAIARHKKGQGQLTALRSLEGQRSKRNKPPVFPPTYIPATKPGAFRSIKSQHLGNSSIKLFRHPREEDGKPRVDHPGFEGRNLTGMLLGQVPPKNDLSNFYVNQVQLRLNQIGVGKSVREFVFRPTETQPRGARSYAVSAYLKDEGAHPASVASKRVAESYYSFSN